MATPSSKRIRTQRGSVLVFTLILLLLLLSASISVATITVSESKSASALSRSTAAFQVADSGMEVVLERIYSGSYDTASINTMKPGGSTCAAGEITGALASGTYVVTLFDSNGVPITNCGSTTWRADAESIQSTGSYAGTQRAVKVDLDPS